ncbi:MAG: PAS domain S-box protein [Anaerolineae bacterium]
MKGSEFEQRVQMAQTRLQDLVRRVGQPGADAEQLVKETVAELAVSLEELQVAQEELREQNEELRAIRHELELERRRYQALFAFAPDGYLVTDPEGVIEEANRDAGKLLGLPPDYMAGKPLALFVSEGAQTDFYARLSRLQAGGEGQPAWRTRFRPRQGEPFPVHLTVAPVRSRDGELVGLRWLVRDVSEQVAAEVARERLLVQVREERDRAERSYQESQRANDLLRAFIENMPVGAIVADREGRILMTNAAGEAILGGAVTGSLPHPQFLYETLTPEGEAVPIEEMPLMRAIRDKERTEDLEILIRRADGTERMVLAAGAPLFDSEGRVLSAVTIFQDITARKDLERERELLLEENRRQRLFLERLMAAIPVGVAVMAGSDYRYEFVNDFYREIAEGYEGPFQGKRPEDIFGEVALSTYRLMDEACELGKTLEVEEFEFQQGEESVFWNVSVVPLDGNEKRRVMVVASDVTEQVRARRQLTNLVAQQEAIFDSMQEGLIIVDAQGDLLEMNPEALRIYGQRGPARNPKPQSDLLEECHLETLDGAPLPPEARPLQRVQRGEAFRGLRLRGNLPEGRVFAARYNGMPVRDAQGKVAMGVITLHDITAQVALEEERTRLLTQLEDERARLRAIIDNTPEGIVVTDQQGEILLSNPAADSLYGATQEEGGEAPVFCYPNGEPCDPRRWFGHRLASVGVDADDEELTLIWPSGKRRDFMINSAPLLDRGGEVRGSVVVFRDVTIPKRITRLLQRRNRILRMVNLLNRQLSATLDLSEVLERLLDATDQLLDVGGSAVWLRDEKEPSQLICRAEVRFPPDHSPLHKALEGQETIVGWAAHHGESVILTAGKEDPRFQPVPESETGFLVESMLAVPLQVHGRVTGVLQVVNKEEGYFNAQDRVLLETLAGSAAIAIENARFHAEAKASVAEEERHRLARDLHDAVSQTLFSASLIAESLPRLAEKDPLQIESGLQQLVRLTQGALAEMRALLLELRPRALVDAAFPDLLRQLTEAINSRTRVEVSLEVEGEERSLPPEIQIALYRIAQEALNNVLKHARATKVSVHLINRSDGVELRIKDDGRGFEKSSLLPDHMGMRIMQERARSHGITLEIHSQDGRGTEVVGQWVEEG